MKTRSNSQTPQKHVRKSEIVNTPTKLLIETGLLVGKSTPETVEYVDDWESSQKENSNNNSPHGSEIYSLSRKHDRLKKLIQNTPSKLAASSPLVNDAASKYASISSSSSSSEGDDEEVINAVDENPMTDKYFAKSGKKQLTSNNTLNFSAQSRQEYLENLKKAPSHHAQHFQCLSEGFKHGYKQWKFELEQGFNLMFYGLGSKRQILNDFVDSLEGPIITLNGYFPTISFRAFIASVVNTLLPEISVPLGSLSNQCDLIHEFMETFPGYITLLIHNIEGQALLKPEVYTTLAKLASHCRIYTVASSDHINTPLLFDMNLMTNFNFLWHDITNYSPYTVETSFENLICEVSGENGASYVLQSLTGSSKRLFEILCKHQLALSLPNDKIHDSSSGLSFDALFSKASSNFVVQELGSFRIMLTEFRDHGLIVGEKREGVEFLYVPFSNDTINEFLE